MKKFLALMLMLCLSLLPAGQQASAQTAVSDDSDFISTISGINDPDLLPYLEDTIYTSLIAELDSEEYLVEDVRAVYISQEYLDELAFNSQANIFFGYTLEELDELFTDSKYVFTLGDNGETVVEQLEDYKNIYLEIVKSISKECGIIVIETTIKTIKCGSFTPQTFFVILGKEIIDSIKSSNTLEIICAGLIEYQKTGDIQEAMKAALNNAHDNFKQNAGLNLLSAALFDKLPDKYKKNLNTVDTIESIANIIFLFIDTSETPSVQ